MFLLPIASLPPYPLTRSVFLLVAAAAANALALLPLLPNASPTLQLPPPLPPPPRAPATLDNATTTTMTTNAGNAIRVTCSAALGSGMVASSCADAVGYSPLGDRQESWGVPGRQMPGALALDVELPDNVFSDDATCVIVPKMEQYFSLAHASARQVTEAARAVMQTCVIARRIGGTARMIGGDNRLAVSMVAFEPHVTCHGAMAAPVRSCDYIMREMLKTNLQERFGHGPDPNIQVALPITLRAPDGKCQVYIETRSNVLWARWFDVWEAVEATVAVCVRKGKWGWSSVKTPRYPVPHSHALSVIVTDEPWPRMLALLSNLTNVSTGTS